MIEEKKCENMQWFTDGKLKIRIKKLDSKRLGLWVSIDQLNICFTMLMYDFVDWCENELNIKIQINNSWNGQRGFIINREDKTILLTELKRFIEEYSIKPTEDDHQFSDDEWYTVGD